MIVLVKRSPMATFSLQDDTGEFLFMEAVEERTTAGEGEHGKEFD